MTFGEFGKNVVDDNETWCMREASVASRFSSCHLILRVRVPTSLVDVVALCIMRAV